MTRENLGRRTMKIEKNYAFQKHSKFKTIFFVNNKAWEYLCFGIHVGSSRYFRALRKHIFGVF